MEATDPDDSGKATPFSHLGGAYPHQNKRQGLDQNKCFSPPKLRFTGLTKDLKGQI